MVNVQMHTNGIKPDHLRVPYDDKIRQVKDAKFRHFRKNMQIMDIQNSS